MGPTANAAVSPQNTKTYSTTPEGGGVADPYQPSSFVLLAHGISKADFALTGAYASKVVTSPAVLFGLGLLSLLCLNCGLAMRHFFRFCRGLPFITPNLEKPEEFINYQRIAVVIFFNAFLVLAFIMDFMSFIGNDQLDKAFLSFESGMSQFQSLFKSLKAGAASLTTYSAALNAHMINAYPSCPNLNALDLKISTFSLNSATLKDTVTDVNQALNTIITAVRSDATKYKNLVFYILWLLALVTIVLLRAFQSLRKRKWVKIAMAFAMITFILEITCCFVFMVATAVFSDICVAPTRNLISVIPVGSNSNYSAQDSMSYYATCTGRSVVGDIIDDTWVNIRYINNSLNILYNTTKYGCERNPFVKIMLDDMARIGEAFGPVSRITACGPVQSVWFDLINRCLCTDLFNGFYGLWLAQLLTSFFIYFAIIMASISYQYYDIPHELVDTDAVMVIGHNKKGNVDFSMVVPIFDTPSATPDYAMESNPREEGGGRGGGLNREDERGRGGGEGWEREGQGGHAPDRGHGRGQGADREREGGREGGREGEGEDDPEYGRDRDRGTEGDGEGDGSREGGDEGRRVGGRGRGGGREREGEGKGEEGEGEGEGEATEGQGKLGPGRGAQVEIQAHRGVDDDNVDSRVRGKDRERDDGSRRKNSDRRTDRNDRDD